MSFCSNCGSHIDDTDIFCINCGQRISIIVKKQQPSIQPFLQEKPRPFKPNSGMGLAFFTTMCCSPIFGVYAMILADEVDTLYHSGRYKEAEMKAIDSKKWSIIGIVFSIIVYLILIITLIVIGIRN